MAESGMEMDKTSRDGNILATAPDHQGATEISGVCKLLWAVYMKNQLCVCPTDILFKRKPS